jgi:arylsulfatase A-like enzyme
MTAARAPAALLLLLALPACGGAAPVERWIDLARVPPERVEVRAVAGELAHGVRIERADGVVWAVAVLARDAWTPAGGADDSAGGTRLHRALLPVIAIGAPAGSTAPYRLELDGAELAYEADLERFGTAPGRFSTRVLDHLNALPSGTEPPERAELRAVLAYERAGGGLEASGAAAANATGARVHGRRLSGAGFWVPGGGARALELDIPDGSRLAFGLALEPVLGAKEQRLAARTFRVRLDGVTVFERALAGDLLGEALEWHAVDLPRGGVRSARLAFEVEGPLALSAFLAPRIGPRETGTYGARPWSADGGGRPDLVLFLADTFRADNLEAYGGAPGLTPEIDRLAREARVFERAWSTSTHTLPAHSSMFSGVFPHQNGQVDYFHPLPAAVETLAEILSARGYRCGAVTDGVMVSQVHGLDQGFESFDERREVDPLERVRAFLGADDGRPVFLFVQSYAAHTPYASSPATRARLADRLDLEHAYEDVYAAALALPAGAEEPPEDAATQRVAAALHDLYRAASAELDVLFGRVRAELEARAILPGGVLLFTSDHGEAFYEHGRPFHAGRPFEEELRVPLLLLGPGIAPGREPRPVSLVDVAPTLAALAGERARSGWEGRSLLDPDPARVIHAFQANRAHPGGSAYAVIDGPRKLMGLEQERDALHAAFDLDADPLERENLLERAAWPAELGRAQRARLEALLTPLVEPEASSLSADKLQELRGMGYTGAPQSD